LGHDASFEVPFFIEADALSWMHPATTAAESGLLSAFDLNRDRIGSARPQVGYMARIGAAHSWSRRRI
jgi:hypothetical protein